MAKYAKKTKAKDELSDDAKAASYWIGEIQRSTKKFKEYQDKCDKIVARYRDERNRTKSEQRRFNILWSNIQTLRPAIFANPPKPVIERRFLADNQTERLAGQILERASCVAVECWGFVPAVVKAVLDYLLAARGVTWWRYEAEFDEQSDKRDLAPESEDYGDDEQQTSLPVVTEEQLCGDYVDRKDFLHDADARVWEEVRWVARRFWLRKKEVTDKFGKEIANKVSYLTMKPDNDNKSGDPSDIRPEAKQAEFWQIWDKTRRTVWVISQSYKDGVCDQYDDPLRLSDFWPCPKPLFGTLTNDTLVPVPDYLEYQDQAEELDDLTRRIAKITQAIKVTGLYDAAQPDLKRLLREGTDNIMVPCESWAVLRDKNGLAGSVEFFPLDMLIKTLQALYEARDSVKEILYEVTGISDIMRGQGAASETATAQRIKGQFGTLRLQDRQKAVALFCKDNIRIVAELIAEHFAPETLAALTGLAEKSEVEMIGEQLMGDQDPQQSDAQEFMQAIQLIKDDRLRSFRLDIETDSIIEADNQAEKQARVEFLGAVGQFLQQAMPAAQQAPQMIPLLGQMLLFGARGFRAGRELESTLEQTVRQMEESVEQQQQNPQQPPNPKAEELQGKAQLQQMQHQSVMEEQAQEHQNDMQLELFKHSSKLHQQEHDMAMNGNGGYPNPSPGQPPQGGQQDQQGSASSPAAPPAQMTGDPSQDMPMIAQAKQAMDQQGNQQLMQLMAQHMQARQQANSPENIAAGMRQDMQAMMQQQQMGLSLMMKAITDANQQMAQAIAGSTAQLVHVAQLMTAPKRIVRNEDGTAIGVETVQH